MSEQKTPFDGKMILVIVLTFAVWMGYQAYLQKKYPDAYKKKPVAEDSQKVTKVNVEKDAATEAVPATTEKASTPETAAAAEVSKPLIYKDANWTVEVNGEGMGIGRITLHGYTDRAGKEIRFQAVESSRNLETNIIGSAKPLYFQLEQTADQQITGIATVGDMKIVKVFNFDSSRYLIDSTIRVLNPTDAFSGLTLRISDTVKKPTSSGFFNPQQEYQEFYVAYEGTNDRQHLAPDVEEKRTFHSVEVAALASQYFAMAVIDDSKIIPDFHTTVQTLANSGEEILGSAAGVLSYPVLAGQKDYQINFKMYAGPKSWDSLATIHEDLTNIVNFGFFQTIAKWIFRLLQSIQAAVGNWGYAIILLTILVRVVVLPFNIMSYRSMKAMAKVQPEMKIIREKYKNDPQKANQEILRVMKDAKANPLGGCLPMLLQIPVFFALYQVLGQSIELYKAPFALWIPDLSLKDPYFVLPVLMGATMFVQQKITPTTMEPAQQKVLLFMPIFLTFLLASLPSGLTLYMFVSTLFGVLQQLYFMRDEKRRAAVPA